MTLQEKVTQRKQQIDQAEAAREDMLAILPLISKTIWNLFPKGIKAVLEKYTPEDGA